MKNVQVNGETRRIEPFSGRKVNRTMRLLKRITREVPGLLDKRAAFVRAYEETNYIELDRAQATLRYGAPVAVQTVSGDFVRDEDGKLETVPSPILAMSEEAWAQSGHKLRLPKSPTETEILWALFPDVFEQAENLITQLLALVLMPNQDVKRYARDGSLDEMMQEARRERHQRESLAKTASCSATTPRTSSGSRAQAPKQFGISKQAALEYTGTFGNLTRALGVSQKDSARISVDLTKQAADMASFNNTTIEDALDALRSGLVGETEPLRRFGVTLSANAIAAEAMRSGIVKVKKDTLEYRAASISVEKAQTAQNKAIKEHGKNSLEARDATVTLEKANKELTKTAAGGKVELTGQQKMQASLSLITRQTAAAQGDFARTSGQSANQSRILHARLDDLQANVGAKVLPVFSRLVKA
jgi:hypothetical protein